jgi:predicted outer membrane repeat protein
VAAVIAAGAGGAATAQAAQAAQAVAVPCSTQALVSALAGASSGATLSLAAGCVYNLTAALPQVSADLSITGNRATLQRSYAAGTPAFTILTVAGSGILTVSDLNFRHGGGAIAVIDQGQLTVNGGTFTGNAAANGGAIYSNTNFYAPQISNATFIRNTATGNGGAIYSYSFQSSVYVTGSVFTGNRAADGGAIWDYGIGGGIVGSRFQRNSAGAGGALWFSELFNESLTGVVIRHNYASGDGGGIYTWDGGGGVNIYDSTVSGNRAGGRGGGVYDSNPMQSRISGSDIEGNKAADGAGIYLGPGSPVVAASTVSGNYASQDGGGIYADSGSYSLTTSMVSGNRAEDGGGIYNGGAGDDSMTSTTVSGNHASQDGGGIYNADSEADSVTTSTVSGNHAAGQGGGIYDQEYVDLTVAGTPITGNRAPGGGGGIFDEGPYITVTLTSSPVTGNKPDNCEPPGSITGCTG